MSRWKPKGVELFKERRREREREKVMPMLNIETCTARGVLAQRDPEWIIHKHFNY